VGVTQRLNKIAVCGLGVNARLETLDRWDGGD
jgi:hypothetical protein